MPENTVFRITFMNQGKVYEIYAKGVSQGGLFGFIEVEELIFGERSKLVIDQSEETLHAGFAALLAGWSDSEGIELPCLSRTKS